MFAVKEDSFTKFCLSMLFIYILFSQTEAEESPPKKIKLSKDFDDNQCECNVKSVSIYSVSL